MNVYVVGHGERGEGVTVDGVFTTMTTARQFIRKKWPQLVLRKLTIASWTAVLPNGVDRVTVDRLPLEGPMLT